MSTQSLTTNKQNEWLEKGCFNANLMKTVKAGMDFPIRDFLPKETLEFQLGVEIQRLAMSYGAKEKINDDILEECFALVSSRFSMLGIGELGEAFRMVAARELPDTKLEIYHGIFNVKILGSVLGAYRAFRRTVVAHIMKEEAEEKATQQAMASMEQKRRQFDLDFPKMVLIAKQEGLYKHWEAVPVFWYKAARRLGLLELEREEALGILAEAKQIVLEKLDLEKTQGNASNRKMALVLWEQLMAGNDEIERVKVVARKLVVWRKLIVSIAD